MKIKIVWIGKTKARAIEELTAEYLKRISRYVPVEGIAVRDETALLEMCGRSGSAKSARTSTSEKSTLVLMDSRGKALSSEEFAKFLENYRDRNPLPLVFPIAPPDRLRDASKAATHHTISPRK